MSKFKAHKSVEQIAKKHRVDISFIEKQLKIGEPIEHEHTKDHDLAMDIALQHLDEIPDYYTRLKKMESEAKKDSVKEETKSGDSSLHDWFNKSKSSDGKKGWVQLGGKYAGKPCARQPGQTTKPKCGSSKMKRNLSKDEEQRAFLKKNRQDPNPNRRGKAINVSTEETQQIRYCPKCKKNETQSECRYGPKYWAMFSIPPALTANQMKYDTAQVHPANEEKDHEHSMVRSQLSTIDSASKRLRKKMKGEGDIEAWVQSKITKAADYLDSAADYVDSGEMKSVKEESDFITLPLNLEVPTSDSSFRLGLMFRESLEQNTGMLFIFDEVAKQSFHMRETKIPLDIAFIDENRIIESIKQLNPFDEKSVYSDGEVLCAIEVNRGWFAEHNVEVGDEIDIVEEEGEKDACYRKVKARYKVWPSAYASGALVKCRKKGASNWGNKVKKESIEESVRIPAKTGNIILVSLTWRGKYYMLKMFFPQVTKPNRKEVQDQIQKVYPGSKVQTYYISDLKPGEQFLQIEDWQKVNRQDKTDGLSQKAVNAYRRENPGSKLQTAVTEKNPSGKRADRRKSFCRRMKGMKERLTSAETARDPDSRINKALRRWRCN